MRAEDLQALMAVILVGSAALAIGLPGLLMLLKDA